MTPSPLRLTTLSLWSLMILAGLWLTGCTSLGPSSPRTFVLSESQLNDVLSRQLPLTRRVLEVVDVKVTTPRVQLLPQSNRMATDLAITATDSVFGRSYQGTLAVDSGLRLDEAVQGIRLTDVRVTKLELVGVPERMQSVVNRLGAVVAEQMLKDLIIYRFKPEDLRKVELAGFKPSGINVTRFGLELAVSPYRR